MNVSVAADVKVGAEDEKERLDVTHKASTRNQKALARILEVVMSQIIFRCGKQKKETANFWQ